jgi:hypothetical protein
MHTTPTPSAADLESALAADLFPALTGNDRCDRDAAEAAVAQVLVPNGSGGTTRLLFCGHHWREAETKLRVFPHDVPEAEAKPMTHRRAAELGAPVQRDAGSVPE